MKMNFLRRLALLCAVLTCGMLLALPAAAAEADAPLRRGRRHGLHPQLCCDR